jgi:hypothetical protein
MSRTFEKETRRVCCCCLRYDRLSVGCGNLPKRKCLFLSVVFLLVIMAMLTFTYLVYATTTDIVWEKGLCRVTDVRWRDNLYSVLTTVKDTNHPYDNNTHVYTGWKIFENGSLKNPIDGHHRDNDDDDEEKNYEKDRIPVLLRVKGWYYYVDVKYDDMYFKSFIKDPSETEIISPLYAIGEIAPCLLMIEKLKSETLLLKDDFLKYKEYLSQMNQNNATEDKKEVDSIQGDTIFFVTATTWSQVDSFYETHYYENHLKATMTVISFVMIFASVVIMKQFYQLYIEEKRSSSSLVV